MKDIGRQFEEDFAAEMGLDRVQGSGNQWHAKLDVKGRGARWTLKATSFESFTIKREYIEEMVEATLGPGGTGEMPMMAIRLSAGTDPIDLVVSLVPDFKAICTEEYTLVQEDKVSARRRLASVPQLLREAEENE